MILELKDLPKPLSMDVLFDGKETLEIEIGTGKGQYIVDMALAHPNVQFIGIEKSIKWFRMADEKAQKRKVTNLVLLHCYLDVLLTEYLPDEQVSRFHVLFPDPWPKHRHKHRRIFQDKLIKGLWLALKPEGEVLFATDYKDYFESTVMLLSKHLSHFFSFEQVGSFEHQSNFQKKYIQEGRELFFVKMTKKGSIATNPDLYDEIQAARKRDQEQNPVQRIETSAF